MNLLKYILFIILSCLTLNIEADDENSTEKTPIEKCLPLSPQASALAKYGEYPVSHATGIPEISIPIYEIDLGEIKIPISLSYHASGIKADEVATTVGLGWSLNAGGIITRSICGGGADLEGCDNTYYNADKLRAQLDSIHKNHGGAEIENILYGNGSSTSRTHDYDCLSDRYTYNFANKSGVFRYSYKKQEFIPANYSKIRINGFSATSNEGNDSFFTILDTDGTLYTFAKPEFTGVMSDERTTKLTSWYLTEIQSKKGLVEFEYKYSGDYTTFAYSDRLIAGPFNLITRNRPGCLYNMNGSEYLYKTPLLTRIKWKGNTVKFTYQNDRKDLWKVRLVKIEVVNSNGDVIKTVELDNYHFWGDSERNYRMLLKSVSVSSEGKYTFVYNTWAGYMPDYAHKIIGTATGFTNGYICHTDYWGYYNGKSGKCFIPKEGYSYIKEQHPEYTVNNFSLNQEDMADRNPDFRYMQYGILESVTYPTGGNTKFEYEQNAPYWGGLHIKSINNYDSNGKIVTGKSYSYHGGCPTTDEPLSMMVYSGDFYLVCYNILPAFGGTMSDIVCVGEPVFPIGIGPSFIYYNIEEKSINGDIIEYHYDSNPRAIDFGGHAILGERPHLITTAVNDYGTISPYMTYKGYKDATGHLLKSEKYEYATKKVFNYNAGNKLVSYIDHIYPYGKVVGSSFEFKDAINRSSVQFDSVTVHSQVCQLVRKEITDHETGFSIVEEYTYDDGFNTNQPKTTKTINSDGSEYITENIFTFESTDENIKEMLKMENCYDRVLETRTYCNNKLLSRNYSTFSENRLNGFFYPSATFVSLLDNPGYEKYRYVSYDRYGNLQELVTNGKVKSSLKWGYNGSYPTEYYTEDRLTNSYFWKPLVGVTCIKSTNGNSVKYAYDYVGRLACISDTLGMKSVYSYNYINGYDNIVGLDNYTKSVSFLDNSQNKSVTSVQYYNGLGMPNIQVPEGVSGNGKCLTTMQIYDSKGRIEYKYNPVITEDVSERIDENEFIKESIKQYADSAMYTKSSYNAADQEVSLFHGGNVWMQNDKHSDIELVTNKENDVCYYRAPMDNFSLVKTGKYYAAGQLYGEKTTDEDGKSITVFKDKLGRKILERRDQNNDTYFVYNDLGQLRFVLSPQYQHAGYKHEYAYEYRYDNKGRVVKKILPGIRIRKKDGKDSLLNVYQYWYDAADRIIYTQDANLREKGLYRFTLYDKYGRLVVLGTCSNCNRTLTGINSYPLATYSSNATGALSEFGYDTSGIDEKFILNEVELVNYYDNYDYLAGGFMDNALLKSNIQNNGNVCTIGLQTGSVVRASNGKILYNVMYYDAKGRVVKTLSTHLDGGLQKTETDYTFTDNPQIMTVTECSSNGDMSSCTYSYTYNRYNDQLQSIDLKIDTNAEYHRIVENTYDDLGRLVSVKRSGNASEVKYAYNIRNWISSISSREFSEKIHYFDGVGIPCFNGNISSIVYNNRSLN